MLSARVATSVCSAARARVPKSTSAAAYSVARHTALPAAAAGCREFTNSSSLPTFYNDTQAKPSSSFVRRAKHPWRPVTHCSAFVPDGLADNQYEELEKAVDRHLNKILDDNAHDKKYIRYEDNHLFAMFFPSTRLESVPGACTAQTGLKYTLRFYWPAELPTPDLGGFTGIAAWPSKHKIDTIVVKDGEVW